MSVNALKKSNWFSGRRGPVVLAIMDGVGFGKYAEGDAVAHAYKPTLDWFLANCLNTKLKAHGVAVGLPSDADMGNSEVGHNAMGAGRVFAQGAKLVANSISSGEMFKAQGWSEISANVLQNNSTLHFIGLFSDGNVHSHIDHLKAMIEHAAGQGVKRIRVHILLDGRDVGETSALEYVDPFEEFLAGVRAKGCDVRIASGGGRMKITMDRYNADWSMVERGWKTHVLGEGRLFKDAHTAIETLRNETHAIDQDLGAFVIADETDAAKPAGPVADGDSVVFFNFRGDRAIEISQAFEAGDDFKPFDRVRVPKVCYAGMMQYDGDLKLPKRFLVNPPAIDRTSGEYLCATGISTFACSETQKYGHVTYFYNGNKSGYIDKAHEEYVEVPSDIIPFEQRPWMKGAQITDAMVEAIASGKYQHLRCNFPNGDMVGHTGVYQAALMGVEAVDLCLGRLKKAVDAAGGILVITADHGNADDMYEHAKDGSVKRDAAGNPKVKTSHSLNPVPCIIYDPQFKGEYKLNPQEGLGISSIAATIINLLGYEAPEDYDPSVIFPA